MARRLAREEGLFVGGSSGLTTQAALAMARELDDPDEFVVTTLADWGEHYLSKLYDDDWMKDMEPPFPVLDGHLDLEVATRLLTRSNAACLVRENGDLSGIVTRYDVVRSIALEAAR